MTEHTPHKKTKQTKKPKAGKWDLISFFDIYRSAILDNNNEAMGERLILKSDLPFRWDPQFSFGDSFILYLLRFTETSRNFF